MEFGKDQIIKVYRKASINPIMRFQKLNSANWTHLHLIIFNSLQGIWYEILKVLKLFILMIWWPKDKLEFKVSNPQNRFLIMFSFST